MDSNQTQLSAAEWQLVKKWLNDLLELPQDQVSTELNQITSDPKLKSALNSLLEVHHDNQNLTISPVQSPIEILQQHGQLKSGDPLGQYTIKKSLGSGGMGSVYLAERNDDIKQLVAIKVLDQFNLDEQSKLRFDTERKIMATLEHPNIARFIDAGTIGDHSYYVMEYIDGVPLDTYCDQNQLSLHQRLDLFKDICSAVGYAHANLIVHRDLKPSNVMVTSDGVLKLLDFGIAKPLSILPGTDAVHETLVGSSALTPQYAAPEQINGENITIACDIYLLGLLLYKLTTKQDAFDLEGKTWGEIDRIINHEVPKAPSSISEKHSISWSKDLKGDLDAMIGHALNKEPQNRYQNANNFTSEINRYLNKEPIEIKRNQNLYRFRKQLRKYWLPITSTAVIFGILLVTSIMIFNQSEIIKQERDKAIEERQLAEETTDFLVDIFKMADTTSAAGNEMTALEVLQTATEKIDKRTKDDPVTFRLMASIGQALYNMNQFNEANKLITDLDVEGVSIRPEDLVKIYLLQARLAQENRGENSRKDAIKLFSKANELIQSGEVLKTEILISLANNYRHLSDRDNYLKAIDLAKHEIYHELEPNSLEFASMQFLYASLLEYEGHNPEVIKMMTSSLSIMEENLDANDLKIAQAHFNIAQHYISAYSDFVNGEKHLIQSERIYQALAGEKNPKFISIQGLYALIYKHKGMHKEAIEAYEAAYEHEVNSLTGSSSKLGVIKHNIAIVYLEDLHDYPSAEAQFKEAMEYMLVENSDNNPNYLWFKIGYTIARSYQEKYQAVVEQEFLDLFEAFKPHNRNFSKGRVLLELSKLYDRQGRLDKAITEINRAIPFIVSYMGDGSQQHNYALELLASYQAKKDVQTNEL